jgi:hypothetical protein
MYSSELVRALNTRWTDDLKQYDFDEKASGKEKARERRM